MSGRSFNPTIHSFGFNNGSEKDDEISGAGNMLTTEFREIDTRLGRMWSPDPIQSAFPWSTPYSYSFNNPIAMNDPTGLAPPDWLSRILHPNHKYQSVHHAKWKLKMPTLTDITRGIGKGFRNIGDAFAGHNYHLNLTPGGSYQPTNSGPITIADHNQRFWYTQPKWQWDPVNNVSFYGNKQVDVNWKKNSEIEFNTSRIESMGKVGSHVRNINSISLQYNFFVQNDEINVLKDGLLNRSVASVGDVLDNGNYTTNLVGNLSHTSILRKPTAYTIQATRNTVKPFSEWNYTVTFNVNAWVAYGRGNARPWWHRLWYGNSGTK